MTKEFEFKPITYVVGFVIGYSPSFFMSDLTITRFGYKLGILFVTLGMFLFLMYLLDKKFYNDRIKRQKKKKLLNNEDE